MSKNYIILRIIKPLQGKLVKMQTNLRVGVGQAEIDLRDQAAGMYIYALIVGGQEVLSKRMLFNK